ncbi:conserved exported hypothetical protein [Tenacibaculum litopenaei]|jgi:nitrite reductase/ring-hydroxylating ferredoxin subunit|uniref:hypothetical protein n=1 Tax=Tenacibaculum litopenaei TaxID=396016 RepID=UPI00389544EF
MKNIFYVFILFLLTACSSSPAVNSCFRNSIQPIQVDLNTPQLNGLLTPNGTAQVAGGLNGIVLFNKGTGGSFSPYIALDRQCPNKDCNTPMTISPPVLECSCDKSKYSMLNGSLISGTSNCDGGARVYNVVQNGSSLQITN